MLKIDYSKTPRQYSQCHKTVFYSATIQWIKMRDAIWRRFMTSSFPSTISP